MSELFQSLRPEELLIVSDLDDTLLRSDHEVSPENQEAIRDFIALGGRFALASGRTEPPVKRLRITTNAPSVLYNGAAVYDLRTGEFLWTRPLSDDIRPLVRDLLAEFPEMGVEVITKKGNYVVRRNAETDEHIGLEHLTPVLTDCSPDLITEPWMKVMMVWQGERLKEVEARLDNLTGENKIRFHYGFTYPILLEINHPEANKGLALKILSDMIGHPLSRIIALGDNLNDRELMQTAGIRIAPANARPEILSLADYISVDNDHHIMRDILAQLTASGAGKA